MQQDTAEIEIHIALGRDGEYELGVTEAEALERFSDYVSPSAPRQVITMTLTLPLASGSISKAVDHRVRRWARSVARRARAQLARS